MLEKDVRDFFLKTKANYNLIAGQKELNIGGLRIDIFAVDKKGNPFIIEFKKESDNHIIGQSATYLARTHSMCSEIEKKLNYFKINWPELKVLCIAKSFNQHDFNSINYQPLKNLVFLYQYQLIMDYREKAISGIHLKYTEESMPSPLYLPKDQTNSLNFKETFDKIASLEGEASKRQYYTSSILPLLTNVTTKLSQKYASKNLFPHISYFKSGPHALVRLGVDKKQSHRASVAITFQEDFIYSGFNLTHALGDAKALQKAIKFRGNKIATQLLKLDEYNIFILDSGINAYIDIEDLDLKGMRLLLQNYNPSLMRDCYIRISRNHDQPVMTEKDILNLFDEEYTRFRFLIEEIRGR